MTNVVWFCLFVCLEILPVWISLLVMVKLEEDHSKQTQDESGPC